MVLILTSGRADSMSRSVTMAPEMLTAFDAARNRGDSQIIIAEMLGVSVKWLVKWMKAENIETQCARTGRPGATKEKLAQACKLHRQGYSYREIASLLGVDWSTIYKWLKKIRTEHGAYEVRHLVANSIFDLDTLPN